MELDYLKPEETRESRFQEWYRLVSQSIILDNAASVLRGLANGDRRIIEGAAWVENVAVCLMEESKKYA